MKSHPPTKGRVEAGVLTPDASATRHAPYTAPRAGGKGGSRPPPALRGDRICFGGVNCYVAGSGPPLVLVHSVNAAASAAEMRPIYEHCSRTHTVFAVDLPGFGFSERSDRHYGPRLMTDALHALAAQIANRCGAVPLDAVAASLGCEFLARAAAEQPARWGRLALVSPTGLNGKRHRRDAPGSTRHMGWLHALLSFSLWSKALYRLLTRPAVIRFFLQRTWGSKDIDEMLWAYDVRIARQPGARFAPLHFMSGSLFSTDIHDVYEALTQPVWMSHGVRGDFTDFRAKKLVRGSGYWQTSVYPTGALPYFEVPATFLQDLDNFFVDLTVPDQAAEEPTERQWPAHRDTGIAQQLDRAATPADA